jgi:hypothetical protein
MHWYRSPNSSVQADIDDATLAIHIEAFFTCVYPNESLNFVHRGTLEQGVREKTTPRLLSLAICLVSARFVIEPTASHPDGGPRAAAWRRELRASLIDQVGRLSSVDLACLILLIRHELNTGNYGSSWILFAIAVRIAYGLQMNDDTNLRQLPSTWIEQESRRRMMWSCIALDAFFADGFREHELCGAGTFDRLQLPCSERNFSFQVPCITSRLPPCDEPSLDFAAPMHDQVQGGRDEGLTSHWIRMVIIRRGVLKWVTIVSPSRDRVAILSCSSALSPRQIHTHDRIDGCRSVGERVILLSVASHVGTLLLATSRRGVMEPYQPICP